jgi:ketosteroid isomerase-like protein
MNDQDAANTSAGAEPRTERLKRIVRETRLRSQMASLPSAVPGEEGDFIPEPTGLQGLAAKAICTYGEQEQAPTTPQEMQQSQVAFASTSLGPVFVSFGPMLADGDHLVEEWESFMYTSNGTMYNNQYVMVLRFDGDEVAEFHLHQDRHHVNMTYGQYGDWTEPTPVTQPRRLTGNVAMYPGEIETPFEIVDQFDVDPAMLRDPVPSDAPAPVGGEGGVEGNRALVLGLRRAVASGDPAAVDRFYGRGFRYYVAGEHPFGWDHLPLREIYAPLVEHLASPLTLRYGAVFADETRAFERMVSFARLDDGTVWHNWHAIMHEIRDGKIVQTREYLDTSHVWATLGRWASWGDQPPQLRSTPRRSNLQGIAMTINYKPNEGPDLERWQPFPPVEEHEQRS